MEEIFRYSLMRYESFSFSLCFIAECGLYYNVMFLYLRRFARDRNTIRCCSSCILDIPHRISYAVHAFACVRNHGYYKGILFCKTKELFACLKLLYLIWLIYLSRCGALWIYVELFYELFKNRCLINSSFVMHKLLVVG